MFRAKIISLYTFKDSGTAVTEDRREVPFVRIFCTNVAICKKLSLHIVTEKSDDLLTFKCEIFV